jgi:hypothetical protein
MVVSCFGVVEDDFFAVLGFDLGFEAMTSGVTASIVDGITSFTLVSSTSD